MCDCSGNIVDLSHLNIYTIMAKYKVKNNAVLLVEGKTIILKESSQKELAYLYEDLGMISFVEKLSTTKTKDEPKKTKKSGKKSTESEE
jgi:hypothetical protein